MKHFASEYLADYSVYTFGYCHYLEWETLDDLGAIYSAGYLPYSARNTEIRSFFYLARSLRVNLERFELDKKARYIHKQFQSLYPVVEEHDKRDLLDRSPGFQSTLTNWMRQRYDPPYLSEGRLRFILERPFLNRILAFSHQGKPFAYVLLVHWNKAVHYWFAFYDQISQDLDSIGKGLMLGTLVWAKSRGYGYVYLGTVYRGKSHYKFRGTGGCEFFDGSGWNPDMVQLKGRLAQDDSGTSLGVLDRFQAGLCEF